MAVLENLLHQLMLDGIFSAEEKEYSNYKAWIANQRYKIHNQPSNSAFEIIIEEKNDFLNCLAFDIAKTSCVAIESITGICEEPKFPKSTGWLIIRLYYSAFFSAHSLLRIFGKSYNHFDSLQARSLNETSKLYGFDNPNISTGSFCTDINMIAGKLKIERTEESHAGLWENFNKLLISIEDNIDSLTGLTEEKNDLVAYIDWLKAGIQKNGEYRNGTWLSHVRNSVNYKFEYRAWHPYAKNKSSRDKLFGLVSKWDCNIEEYQRVDRLEDAIVHFGDVCLNIVILNKSLLSYIYDRNKKSNLLKNGFIRLINEAKK